MYIFRGDPVQKQSPNAHKQENNLPDLLALSTVMRRKAVLWFTPIY